MENANYLSFGICKLMGRFLRIEHVFNILRLQSWVCNKYLELPAKRVFVSFHFFLGCSHNFFSIFPHRIPYWSWALLIYTTIYFQTCPAYPRVHITSQSIYVDDSSKTQGVYMWSSVSNVFSLCRVFICDVSPGTDAFFSFLLFLMFLLQVWDTSTMSIFCLQQENVCLLLATKVSFDVWFVHGSLHKWFHMVCPCCYISGRVCSGKRFLLVWLQNSFWTSGLVQ